MMRRKNVLSGLGLEGKRPVCSSRKRSRGPAELLMVRNSHQLAEKEKHHLQSQLWMEVISCESSVIGALVPRRHSCLAQQYKHSALPDPGPGPSQKPSSVELNPILLLLEVKIPS